MAPEWNETKDIIVSDFDQCIKVDVYDHGELCRTRRCNECTLTSSPDANSDDQIGEAVTTVRELLLTGGKQELPLLLKDEETGGKVAISAEYHKFEADGGSLTSSNHKSEGLMSGVATVLVANVKGIKGQREALKPSVVITWGSAKENRFQTAIKSDAPGMDMNNPSFDQNFRLPVTVDAASGKQDFRIALMDGEKEVGGVNVPFGDVLQAPDMTLQNSFDVGNGAKVKASICLRGLGAASSQDAQLPDRSR